MTVGRGNSLTHVYERELQEPAWSLACDIITSGTERELGTEVCKSRPDSRTFMTKNDISRPLYGENTQYLWREKGSNVPKHVQSISTIGTLGILQMYSAFIPY